MLFQFILYNICCYTLKWHYYYYLQSCSIQNDVSRFHLQPPKGDSVKRRMNFENNGLNFTKINSSGKNGSSSSFTYCWLRLPLRFSSFFWGRTNQIHCFWINSFRTQKWLLWLLIQVQSTFGCSTGAAKSMLKAFIPPLQRTVYQKISRQFKISYFRSLLGGIWNFSSHYIFS